MYFFSDSKVYMVPYQSQTAVFNDFLLRATKYSKLQMLGDDLTTDKKIILVEVRTTFTVLLELLCKQL